MRMTGAGSQLGFVSEMYKRAVNGGSRATMIPAGSAQPRITPTTTTATPTAATAVSSPAATTGAQPTPNLSNDVILLRAPIPFEGSGRRSPGQTPPARIQPGPNATSGSSSGGSAYGPTEYYGAPEGSADAAAETADAKKGGGLLPIGLILWALFGT